MFLRDEGCLVRTTNTYDWDSTVERCQLLVDVCSYSVRDRDEHIQQKLQQSARRQLLQTDDWNNTPIHLACYNRAPYPTIQAILDAAAAADLPNLAYQTKQDRTTPLSIACATGASSEVIALLLNPPGFHNDHSPPGSSLQNTRPAHPQPRPRPVHVASIVDTQGSSPLQELCLYYNTKRTERRHRENSPSLDEADLIHQQEHYSQLFQNFWQSVTLILQSSSWNTTTHHSSLLHSCAAMAECVPPELSRFVLRNYRYMAAAPDRNGVLPLHLAVSASLSSSSSSLHVALERNRSALVEQLCQLYPVAARKAVFGYDPNNRERKSRSPFPHAIAAGQSWRYVLAHLAKCAPEAVCARDPVTHFHPFLLAAAATSSNHNTETTPIQRQRWQWLWHGDYISGEVLQVETTYELLRRNPQVLAL